MSELSDTFELVIMLCEELEDAKPMPTRLRRRIAHAYDRAVEKALCTQWGDRIVDTTWANRALFRHAERGAREFVP